MLLFRLSPRYVTEGVPKVKSRITAKRALRSFQYLVVVMLLSCTAVFKIPAILCSPFVSRNLFQALGWTGSSYEEQISRGWTSYSSIHCCKKLQLSRDYFPCSPPQVQKSSARNVSDRRLQPGTVYSRSFTPCTDANRSNS
eukprot:GFKZ01010198.1.p1 GENE.GFKZ01010198.1~~GFKZ01010198.1.p1  ORF type:complete len:141 (-),score=0.78 GFKZ01010198.1:227-649(-)